MFKWKTQKIKFRFFEKQPIRAIWDEKKEEWYFSVVDIIGVLTDSVNPTDYLKKLRKRDELLGEYIGTICPHVEMKLAKVAREQIEKSTGKSTLSPLNAKTVLSISSKNKNK